MSNDDLRDLGRNKANPLDDDLLEEMGQSTEDPTLMADAAASPPPADESAAMSPLLAGASPLFDDDAALASPLPADEEAATPELTEEEQPGFLARLAESNPYTVILAASLAALLVAILCLILELGSYSFDVKAKEAGQSARISTPLDADVALA